VAFSRSVSSAVGRPDCSVPPLPTHSPGPPGCDSRYPQGLGQADCCRWTRVAAAELVLIRGSWCSDPAVHAGMLRNTGNPQVLKSGAAYLKARTTQRSEDPKLDLMLWQGSRWVLMAAIIALMIAHGLSRSGIVGCPPWSLLGAFLAPLPAACIQELAMSA
jgi:hypothetical protein